MVQLFARGRIMLPALVLSDVTSLTFDIQRTADGILADTGGEILGTMLIGGALVIGGIGLLFAMRRRAGLVDEAEEDSMIDGTTDDETSH